MSEGMSWEQMMASYDNSAEAPAAEFGTDTDFGAPYNPDYVDYDPSDPVGMGFDVPGMQGIDNARMDSILGTQPGDVTGSGFAGNGPATDGVGQGGQGGQQGDFFSKLMEQLGNKFLNSKDPIGSVVNIVGALAALKRAKKPHSDAGKARALIPHMNGGTKPFTQAVEASKIPMAYGGNADQYIRQAPPSGALSQVQRRK